jgi:CubicO group peptidase (beta-lactamase class C family)
MTPSVAIKTDEIEALLAPYSRTDRPGVVVGVAHQGRPVFRKGYGLANVELPVTLSPSIRIRIGSTTKHFCCLAIMLLAEDGRLSPQDSLRKHLPELKRWAESVTIAAAMSHTGGVRCSLDILTATSAIMSRPLAHEEQVRLLAKLETANFAPGESWMYSNGGYVLLTEIVRRISRQSFESFLKERILTPAGLHNTFARPTDTDLIPNCATPHVPNASGGFDRGVFGPDIGGEGNILSTVDDMLLWLKHMSRPVVGSPETWAAMQTPATLKDGTSTGYGYGLAVDLYRGLTLVGHGGTVVGGHCQMLKVKEHEVDIVILTNVAGVDVMTLGEQIVERCFDGLPAAAAPPEEKELPEGAFYSQTTGRYVKIVRKDGQPALDINGAPFPLAPTPGRPRYWLRTNMKDGASIRALDDGSLEVREFGVEKLTPVAPPIEGEAAAVAGIYTAREIGATAHVEIDDTGAHFRVVGPFGWLTYTMQPIAAGVWSLLEPRTRFTAQLERADGALLFSSSRARRLRFEPGAPSGQAF